MSVELQPGTATAPLEIYGVLGTPNVFRADNPGRLRFVCQLEGSQPPVTFSQGVGEVVLLRWQDIAGGGERYSLLGADRLDESCYFARPDGSRGFRVLDEGRAYHEASYMNLAEAMADGAVDQLRKDDLQRRAEADYLDGVYNPEAARQLLQPPASS